MADLHKLEDEYEELPAALRHGHFYVLALLRPAVVLGATNNLGG